MTQFILRPRDLPSVPTSDDGINIHKGHIRNWGIHNQCSGNVTTYAFRCLFAVPEKQTDGFDLFRHQTLAESFIPFRSALSTDHGFLKAVPPPCSEPAVRQAQAPLLSYDSDWQAI